MSKTLTWSYGGGTQSIAIALLIAQGRLPTPEITVFADTGMEASETFEYTRTYVSPLLATLGIEIEIASQEYARVGMYSHKRELLPPAFTEHGKMATFCSKEWKARVIQRYLRAQGVKECVTWLGMSTDEVERLKPSDVKWQAIEWPLCFLVPMNRTECRQLILNYGWPEPPKSSCWMCPNRRNGQWQRLKMFYPADFARAVAVDKAIRAEDTKGGVWLHEERRPLDEIDFTTPDQPELLGCDSGYCFV